jgi:AraC-like DNA-binding protein
MDRVEQHILAHYAEPLQLDDLAHAVYLSPYYISRLFQRELGTTFLKYLTGVRMRHAREMLVSTPLPVDLVAHRVGYASARRFRTIFRRHHGCTPTDFRRRGKDADLRVAPEARSDAKRLAVSQAG